jgi:hypothetical protein
VSLGFMRLSRRRLFSALALLAPVFAPFFAPFFAAFFVTTCLVTAACEGGGQRALVLVDASGPAHSSAIDARASAFEKQRGRAVRVLRIASGEAAVELAARGEADALILPEATSVDRFLVADHGAAIGVLALPAATTATTATNATNAANATNLTRLRILTINPRQHPKVDPQGADLAAFFTAP